MALTLQRLSTATNELVPFTEGVGYEEDLMVSLGLGARLTELALKYPVVRNRPMTAEERKVFVAQLRIRVAKAMIAIKATRVSLRKVTNPRGATYTALNRKLQRQLLEVTDLQHQIKNAAQKNLRRTTQDLQVTTKPGKGGTTVTFGFAGGQARCEIRQAVLGFVDLIDQLLSATYFQVLSDSQKIKVPGTDKQVFQSLARLSIVDCQWLAHHKNSYAVAMGLCDPNPPSGQDPRRFVDFDLDKPDVWIPNRLALFVYDDDQDAICYTPGPGGGSSTNITQDRIGCYRIGGTVSDATLQLCTPPLVQRQTGGSGAMRADPVSEVDYRWQGPMELGLAIGLVKQKRKPPGAGEGFVLSPGTAPTPGATTPVRRTKEQGITYYHKYVALPAGTKRNAPFDTWPLQPAPYATSDAPGTFYQADGMVLKQKGDWQYAASGPVRTGVTLAGATAARLDAGRVMLQAMRLLVDPNWPRGSATDFAQWAIQQPPAAADWTSLSAGLQTRDDSPASPQLVAKIRTDQEWCHLFGHGDGGTESVENFISGSKHCNTEQLAIELAQRVDPGAPSKAVLTAKITAYLFADTPRPKRVLQLADRTFLQQCNPAVFPASDFGPGRDSLLVSAAQPYLSVTDLKKIRKVLPTAGNLPTQAQWDAKPASRPSIQSMMTTLLRMATTVPLPLGRVVRYKIYVRRDTSEPPLKVVDHSFWAQKDVSTSTSSTSSTSRCGGRSPTRQTPVTSTRRASG